MDRFSSAVYLTTSEAADLLDVHPSTVKRWCNEEVLSSDTTEGGHRRIHLDAVLDAAGQREIATFLDPFAPYQQHVWLATHQAVQEGSFTRARSLALGWLRRGLVEKLGALVYRFGRLRGLEPVAFVDGFVRGFMEDVGSAWRDGRIRVGDEHIASQAVLEAILSLRPEWTRDAVVPAENERRPTAVVGSMESEHHHLGAMCIRLLLERAGWRVIYLGPNVPADDFGIVQRAHGAQVVGISLAPPHAGPDMQRTIRTLQASYRKDAPYALAFGGGGCVEEGAQAPKLDGLPFRQVGSFTSAAEFLTWLPSPFGEGART